MSETEFIDFMQELVLAPDSVIKKAHMERMLKIVRHDGSIREVTPLKTWRQRCICKCKEGGSCEHDFSGEPVYTKNSGSVVCVHCGMTAMEHDTKLF